MAVQLAPRLVKGLTLVGLGVVFMSDRISPLGIGHGNLYLPLVALAGATHSRRWVGGTTLASLGLTAAGLGLSPPSAVPLGVALVNRSLSMGAIALIGGLLLAVLNHLRQQQQAQQQLSDTYATLRSQQTLVSLASQIGHLGGWLVQLPAHRVIWSEEVCRIHGVAPGYSPTLAEAIAFYIPPDRDRIAAAFSACAVAGTPFDEELQIATVRGEQRWVRAIGQPQRDRDGHLVAVQGAFQDITPLKQAEMSLERSERRFRQLADAMPLIVWSAEPNGTVDYANQALRGYTGIYEPDPDPSQTWLALLHPDDREPCIEAWSRAVQTGSPYSVEFRLRNHGGEYRWHLTQAVPIRDEAGQIVKWYGTCTEIHDQKRLEQEARALAERFYTTLESITDAFFTLDPQWRVTFMNGQAEVLLQRSSAELLGQEIWQAFPAAAGSGFDHHCRVAMAEGRSVQFREYYAPLGRWFEVRAYPSSEGLAVYFQDVSDRLVLEDQLRQAQRLESVGQLTGGIAHDFNNLLTVILGNAELLSEMLAEDPRLLPLAQLIGSAAQRGADLTQRLLAFARRQALDPEPTDVNQLLATMDGLLRRTLGEHIEIETLRGAGLWTALIDPAQLESAVLNLCLNARDAMAPGGRLTLETANAYLDQRYADQQTEVLPGQYVMVAVSDTGSGIAPEHLGQVFEPFFTTKAKGKGTGLGLSMVYGFVKQSGGHVKLYSELGHGTTVRMYLPRFQGQASAPATTPAPAAAGGAELILLVEDDDLVRGFAHRQLADLGYRVLVASNGPEALALVRHHDDIDLLFTDVVMPGGLNGRALAAQAIAQRPGLRVLYTSGYTENAMVHQGRLDLGVQLLSKPYSRLELAQKIREALATPPANP
jgi:PAS domain S-box-containing protein